MLYLYVYCTLTFNEMKDMQKIEHRNGKKRISKVNMEFTLKRYF